ncbi:MAG: cytochrome P450 [Steroidobacteraceae bacterium]|jgi:cytochrome P450
MEPSADAFAACPVAPSRDERKSARLAAERVAFDHEAQVITRFSFARDLLRNGLAKQAGADPDQVDTGNPEHAPVFYLDGEAHRRKRSAIARLFTATAVTTRYRAVMERATDTLLARLRAAGEAQLDTLSLELAVAVAAEIVGLTDSDRTSMSARIGATLSSGHLSQSPRLGRLLQPLVFRYHALNFYYRDVRPAIAARRRAPREDLISQLLDESYSNKAIMIECMTYAVAGMVTTREFIVMAAWHLFERDDLRARFLAGDETDQLAILDEILRLEPVASVLQRRAAEDMAIGSGTISAGTLLAIDIRAANTDESVTGSCPHVLDPDRAKRQKSAAGYLSFGYGSHRCPGSQVAMHETRVFLDRLLRVPGIRLEQAPTMGWNDMLSSYELRGAMIACDRG